MTSNLRVARFFELLAHELNRNLTWHHYTHTVFVGDFYPKVSGFEPAQRIVQETRVPKPTFRNIGQTFVDELARTSQQCCWCRRHQGSASLILSLHQRGTARAWEVFKVHGPSHPIAKISNSLAAAGLNREGPNLIFFTVLPSDSKTGQGNEPKLGCTAT